MTIFICTYLQFPILSIIIFALEKEKWPILFAVVYKMLLFCHEVFDFFFPVSPNIVMVPSPNVRIELYAFTANL